MSLAVTQHWLWPFCSASPFFTSLGREQWGRGSWELVPGAPRVTRVGCPGWVETVGGSESLWRLLEAYGGGPGTCYSTEGLRPSSENFLRTSGLLGGSGWTSVHRMDWTTLLRPLAQKHPPGTLTCEDAILLSWLLPADLQRGVQDFTEAQVSHRTRHCTPKGPPPHPTHIRARERPLSARQPTELQGHPRTGDKAGITPELERSAWPLSGWVVRGAGTAGFGWCLPSSWVRTSWGVLRGPSPGVVKHSTEVKYSVNFFRPDTKPTWMLS